MRTQIEPTNTSVAVNVDAAEAETARSRGRMDHDHPLYKWIALSNTTLGTLLATINASTVLISLPAIFRGIGLNPLAPANIGFAVFTVAAIALSFDPLHLGGGAVWLIAWPMHFRPTSEGWRSA